MARAKILRRIGLGGLCLLVLPFVVHAVDFGWRGLTRDLSDETYLWVASAPGQTRGLMVHMITGGAITLLVPVQAALGAWGGWPVLHRWLGRILLPLALVTAFGGLVFIAGIGTIGGRWMDLGFTLYGALMLLAALKAWRRAVERDWPAHRAWALRLVVLALASWMFRVHYGLWFLATGGLGSTSALDGPFDRVQVLAFFVPYLALLEVWLRRRGARG